MAWKTFELPKIPSGVDTAVGGLKDAASAAATALKLVKTITEGLSALSTTTLSTSQSAIKAAVGAIESAVKSLTEDTGVYVLLVPPRSKVIIPAGAQAALSSATITAVNTPGLNLQASFVGEPTTDVQTKILRNLFTSTSGNDGFVRSVVESFDDPGDANRPMLADTDAVAGMYIVAGSSNIASILPFTNGMSSLMSPGRPTALDAPEIPPPQDFRAKVVSAGAVRVQWKFQQPIVELPTLNTFAKVTEVAIMRSTSSKILSESTPQGVFGTNQLTAGKKTGDEKTEVVAVVAYEGVDLKSTYLDDSEHKPGTAYYYMASFHVKLGTITELTDGGGTDIGFTRFSNIVKVHFSKEDHGTPRSVAGVPPDWYRTPRTIDLFPAVGKLLNQVASLSVQFGDTATGYGELLKSNIKVIEQQLKIYEDLAANLTSASSAISAFSSLNLGAVSMRAFAGSGGVNFVKQDIVKAFGDTSDPNRPPFDGDQFVSGVVVLATTPDAAALLDSVLGNVTAGVSAIADALEKIDVQLADIEEMAFGDDMQPHPATPVTEAPPEGLPQIGEQTDGFCFHSFESNPTFNDDLNPK